MLISRRTLAAAAAALLAATTALAARAQAKGAFSLSTHVLKAPGRVLDVAFGDVDGDGKTDLIVAHLMGDGHDENGAPLRYISVFRQGEGGKLWQPAPSLTRNVPEDAVAFAVGDFDDRPGADLVFVGSRFLTLMNKAKDGTTLGQVAPICSLDGFFDYPGNAHLARWDLAADLGSGRTDLVAPVKEGYVVFKNDPKKGLVRGSLVRVPSTERFGPAFETKFLNRFLTYFMNMPKLCAVDLDGDGKKDLVVYRKKGLARFLQRADGTFPESPDDEKPLAMVEEASRRGKKVKGKDGKDGDSFANIRLSLVDLDRDGFADMVATKTIGEIGVFETLRTQIVICKGSKKGFDESKPDRIINQKGVTTDPQFVDFEGKGKLDLVLSSLRMDYFTNVKRAITSSITITYSIYLQKDTFFSDEPDFTKDVELDLAAIERRTGAENVSFEADMNGDKLHDMIVRLDRTKLRIVPGSWESGVFSGKSLAFDESSGVDVTVPANADYEVQDLYKDGKGDALVVTCPGPDDPENRNVKIIEVRR